MPSGESPEETEREARACFMMTGRFCPEGHSMLGPPCVAWDGGCKVLKFMDSMVAANQKQAELPALVRQLIETGWASSLGR